MAAHTTAPTFKDSCLALLIDAHTIPARYAPLITARVLGRYGHPILRRVYGDWSSPAMAEWKRQLKAFEFDAIERHRAWRGIDNQQARRDPAWVEDAIGLLDIPLVKALCVVSAEDGLTGLATFTRQNGRKYYGLGLRGAGQALVRACDDYFWLDREAGAAH